MFSYILIALYAVPLLLCIMRGDADAVSSLMTGADEAVRFCISAAGGLCFWCAVTELFEQCGAAETLSGLLRPVIRRFFPNAAASPEACAAISENISANLMGLGNAATPAGIRAAKAIVSLGDGREIADELCMLVVINTASIQIIPTTAAALRAAAGSSAPFDILPAVWAVSALSLSAGLCAAFVLKKFWK